MDITSFKFSHDKKSFIHKNETYILESTARNNNVLFRCKVDGCSELNSDLTKVISGSSVHNHLKRFSPQNNSNVINNTKLTKVIRPTGEIPKSSHRSTQKYSLNTKHHSPASSLSSPLSSMIESDNKSHNISSESTFTDNSNNTLQSHGAKIEEWIIIRNGLIDKIASQEIEITNLRATIESLNNELSSFKTVQPHNAYGGITSVVKKSTNTFAKKPKAVNISSAPSSSAARSSCFIIGDSHVRGLTQQFQSLVSNGWNFQSVFQPGAGFKAVGHTHSESPSLITPDAEDAVILICGTNDICSSTWDDVQHGIDALLLKFRHCQSICLVGVPLRHDSRGLNRHIIRFNTKVKNYILKLNSNLLYIDPTRFIKLKSYRFDGIHLNVSGKRMLCNKIKSEFLNNLTCSRDVQQHTPATPAVFVSTPKPLVSFDANSSDESMSPTHTFAQATLGPVQSPVSKSLSTVRSDSAVPESSIVSVPAAISTPQNLTPLNLSSMKSIHVDSLTSSGDTLNATQYVSFVDQSTPIRTIDESEKFNIPVLGPLTRSRIRNETQNFLK